MRENGILLDGKRVEKDWNLTWKGIKARLKKDVEEKRKEEYLEKQIQSEMFENTMKAIISG